MTSIHPNSSAAYAETAHDRGNLESRIVGLMADRQPRTDRQVQLALGHPEALRPRITRLIETGVLFEVGDTICEVTHKRVRLTKRFL